MKESCFKGRFCSKAGFTLIELLVVVLIIGILAAVAVPQYQKAVEKSRLAEALTNIDTVVKNVELSVLENGTDEAVWVDHNNWVTDLSGGEWNDSQQYFTKNFSYEVMLPDYITVMRCNGTCTNNWDVNSDNGAHYELSVYYPGVSEESGKYCIGKTSLGKYICQALTAQGWIDGSDYSDD